MHTLIKILVVEDEMIIAAKVSMQLNILGYDVTGIFPHGEDAINFVHENKPDIVLLEVDLKGKLDGIETAKQLNKLINAPIIYITANTDDDTFNRAKATKPAAFISKPFKQLDLQRAIELTLSRIAENETGVHNDMEHASSEDRPFILSDRIFVRHKDKMIKIMIADILYIEAERNYSRIYTSSREYLLSVTLKTIEEKFSAQYFIRIHRSFIINLLHVDEVAESHVLIEQKTVAMSAGMKEHLMERIQTL